MKKHSKILVLLLLFTLIFTLTACQEEKANIEESQEVSSEQASNKQLNKDTKTGEVKYLLTEMIREDVKTGKKQIALKKEYDKEGRLLSLFRYDEGGKARDYEKYEYNKDGKVKRLIELRNVDGSMLEITRIYSYDKQGRKIGYIDQTEVGAKCGEGKFEYHDNGQLKYEYKRNIYQGRVTEIYYNEEGEKTKKIDNSSILNIHTISKFEQEHDENRNKIKEIETITIEETGEKIWITTYYNEFGKSEKYIKENEKRVVTWFERKYDRNANEIKFISKDNNGNIEKVREYKYDGNGNEIEMIRRDRIDKTGGMETVIAVIKKYDKNGNKIKVIYKWDEDGVAWRIDSLKYQKVII